MSELLNIQQGYFEIIKKYFGHLYKEARRTNSSYRDIAVDFLSQPRFRKLLEENLDDTFKAELSNYWADNFEVLVREIEKLKGLKLYFSGDLSPADKGVVNQMGLYADTIIIPDPALRTSSKLITEVTAPHLKYFYLIRHTLKILEYEDVVFSKTPQPIAVFFPSEIILSDKKLQDEVNKVTFQKTVKFLNENLLEQQGSFNDWVKYFEKLNNIDQFKKILKNADAFLFDSNINDKTIDAQLNSLIEFYKKYTNTEVQNYYKNGLSILPHSIMGRMGQSSWHMLKSEILKSHPFQDAYVSWHYLKWNMESEQKLDKSTFIPECLIEEDFKFLSNVPTGILIKLRQEGQLQDLRDCIGKEISADLKTDVIVKQVKYNLENEFIKHQQEVENLDKKFRSSLKTDIPSLIASLGLGVLGVASANPWLGITSAALGGSSLWSIAEKKDDINEKKKEFKESFWGFFGSEPRR